MKHCGYKPDGVHRCMSSAAVRISIKVTDGKHSADRLLGIEVCSEHTQLDWSRVEAVIERMKELSAMLKERFPNESECLGQVQFIPLTDGEKLEKKILAGDITDPTLPVEIVRADDLPPELAARMGFRLS